jgi:hypothetical protein
MVRGWFLLHEVLPDFGPLAVPMVVVPLAGMASIVIAGMRRWEARMEPLQQRPLLPPLIPIAIASICLAIVGSIMGEQVLSFLPRLAGGVVPSILLFSLPWYVVFRGGQPAEWVGAFS